MPLRDRFSGRAGARPPRRNEPSRFNLWFLAAVLFGLISGGVVLYAKSQSMHIRVDPTTLCPTDHPPAEVIVILLDMSSQLSKPQQLRVQNELTRVRNGVPRFGLVEIYSVDRIGERVSAPTAQLCNPGTGEDLNRVYQNPELAKRKWQEFARKLSAELDRLLSAPDTESSPIFEAVQATSLRTFGLPVYDNVPKRLVIVSDLIQHVPGKLSHYRGVPSFAQFRNTSYFSEVRANLEKVKVTLFYLVRSNAPTQGRQHIDFWDQYFTAQGAKVQEVKSIYGDQ